MARRTIRTGIGSYQRPDGQWTHGAMGDDVEVHEGDLERFDRLQAEALGALDEPVTEDVAPKPARATKTTAKPKD